MGAKKERNTGYWAWTLLLFLALAGPAAALNSWSAEGPAAAVNQVLVVAEGEVWVAAADGLYRRDGEVWQKVEGVLDGVGVLALAVAEERLWAGTSAGLFVSTDGGVSWEGAGIEVGVLSLAAAGRQVWAGTFGRGVWRSADGGASWDSGLGEALVFALAPVPQAGNTVFAGTADGVWRSADGGVSWERAGEELAGASVRALRPSALDAGLVWAGTFGAGVWRSLDGGRSWQAFNEGMPARSIRALDLGGRQEGELAAATADGGFFLYTVADGWRAVNQGFGGANARYVHFDPFDSGLLWGAAGGSGALSYLRGPEPRLVIEGAPLDFGTVALGRTGSRQLVLRNGGSGELRLEAVVGGPDFSVELPAVLGPGEEAALGVVFRPQDRGVRLDSLVLHSNDRDTPMASVGLRGVGVQAELEASPVAVAFGHVPLGAFVDTTIVLVNGGNGELSLDNVLVGDASFALPGFVPQVLGPGASLGVRLRFQPQRTGGFIDRLAILSDDPQRPRLEIALNGTGTAADINVEPLALDFGRVDLGQEKNLHVRVSNSGNSVLRLHEARFGGVQFRMLTALPLEVAEGDSVQLEVGFVPLTGGVYADTLRLLSDAPGPLGSLGVALRGVGGALALQPEDPLAVGAGPADMAVADLNGDGKLDVAVVDSVDGRVRVWLNDGTGAYPEALRADYPGPGAVYAAWDRPVALAAAPVLGGAPDLLVVDRVGRSLSILANDGAGGFALERRDLYLGRGAADVVAADFDADGDSDIAVADGDAPSLTLLFNNGGGPEASFNARSVYRVEEGPVALRAGHLDADGHLDLVVANHDAGTISVLRNDRRGGFLPRVDHLTGIGPAAVGLADFDADGDSDIVVANNGSRDVALWVNNGAGAFEFDARLLLGMAPVDLVLGDMSADVFSDLAVASAESPFVSFLENDAGQSFTTKEIATTSSEARRVAIFDADGDGDNDLAILGADGLRLLLNSDTRRLDPPRPPTSVAAADLGRDLGRRVEITWKAPDLDEEIGRTTEYAVFRAAAGDFVEIGRVPAGQRRFVDEGATLGTVFSYYVVARNAAFSSAPSATAVAVSEASPFFELELVNEPRLSVGDTLKVRAYLTPAGFALAGASLYLSFADSALVLLPADSAGTVPFRPDSTMTNGTLLENRLQPREPNKINVSFADLDLPPGVEPVPLGEVWFSTSRDTVTAIAIDDEPGLNRRSAVVEAGTGEWILPFIPARPARVEIRDFKVHGRVGLEGRTDGGGLQVSFSFVDSTGALLHSRLNDEDRLKPGIQYTLAEGGTFALAQIPRGAYRVFVKPPNHLQGVDDTVAVGDSLHTRLDFTWTGADSSSSELLPAGDSNGDNQVNLADFGLFLRYTGVSTAQPAVWGRARGVDFNGDGRVDNGDFFLLGQNYGRVGLSVLPASTAAAAKGATPGPVLERRGGLLRIDADGALAFSLVVPADAVWEPVQGWRMRQSVTPTGLRLWGSAERPQRNLLNFKFGAPAGPVDVLAADGWVYSLNPGPAALPHRASLGANYPNPFNPETVIPFEIGTAGPARLEVYDILGQRLRLLFDGFAAPGRYRAVWDGRDAAGEAVASGTYFYRLRSGGIIQSRSLLLLR